MEIVKSSKGLYFDKFCQIKMPAWTKGRVALIGDAAYCPSHAAGKGGSLAIIGGTTLADALQNHNGDFELAFDEYNNTLRLLLRMFSPKIKDGNWQCLANVTVIAGRL